MNGIEEAPKRPDLMPAEIVLLQSGHAEKAIPLLDDKLREDPQNWQHHTNIGIAYRISGKFLLAVLHQKLSTQIKPTVAATWHNLAVTETEIGDFDSAFVHFQKAYELEPSKQQSALGYAYALMREGKLDQAWPFWEQGRYRNSWFELPGVPAWDGESPLDGKRLLVMKEGGYGDAIMFLRWFPDLQARGAKVSFYVWDKIAPIFEGHPWLDEVLPCSVPLNAKDFDYCTSLMSLPALLRCKPDAIPAAPKYIMARPGMSKRCKLQDIASAPLKFGICWRAEENGVGRKSRSISDEEIQMFSDITAHWVSLVPGADFWWTDQGKMEDWGDTAAIVDQLDAVVTVDTAVAHLAGAMGKPTYVIVPLGSDWKWFRRMEDSPWYPSMKVIRNTDPDSFAGAIEQVKMLLNAGR